MEKNQIKALVITGFGLNCETETAAACKLVGATPELVHLNDLIAGKHTLDEYHFLTFIGGFSFGDHLGSGTVFANRVKFQLREQLQKFVDDGKLPLLVHCTAGISRSGAVGEVLNWYFNRYLKNNTTDDEEFVRNNRQIQPNTIVRKIMLKVLQE